MKIMLISDTHDNMFVIRKISLLVDRYEPDLIIHCGDYISPFAARKLRDTGRRIIGVWGNNDGDKHKILEILQNSKFSIYIQPAEVEINGQQGIIFHGWKSPELTKKIIYSIAMSGKYKYVFYGHTHQLDIKIAKNGKLRDLDVTSGEMFISPDEFDCLVANPGEASGWLTNRGTSLFITVDDKISIEPICLINEKDMERAYELFATNNQC